MNHARQFQVRAVRRMGELLDAIEPGQGARDEKREEAGCHPFRTNIARSARLSEHQ